LGRAVAHQDPHLGRRLDVDVVDADRVLRDDPELGLALHDLAADRHVADGCAHERVSPLSHPDQLGLAVALRGIPRRLAEAKLASLGLEPPVRVACFLDRSENEHLRGAHHAVPPRLARQTGRNRVMSSAKVFIFAPVEEARDSHRRLEAEGCELRLGKASWDTPQGHGEPELIRMAQGAHALMGTSIRNVPISRKIMESSPELRVVAKYTIGVDDVDVEAATELGILVCHGPTESNWGGVAEGTVTAMLTMLKKARERDRHLKDGGGWRDAKLQGTYIGSRGDGYAGITLGLIGLGRI